MADDPLDRPEVDALYELDPSEFTKARNDLAKQLRGDGDREAADAVKQLSRPTVVAWALNQVARAQPNEVEALLAAGAKIRDAQEKVLGGGKPDALRSATDDRRQVIARLASAAAEHLGDSHRDDVSRTLEAASVDADAGDDLRSGRLTKALEPASGFGLEGMPAPTAASARQSRDADADRRRAREVRAAERAVEKAEDKLRKAESRRDDAKAAAERAEADVDAATREHAEAVAALEEARR